MKLVTIKEYTRVLEAELDKSNLEHQGIYVFLKDELNVSISPSVSYDIDGVKLQVKLSDQKEAIRILNDSVEPLKNEKGQIIACPSCSKEQIKRVEKIYKFNILRMLFPFFNKLEYFCLNCESRFE